MTPRRRFDARVAAGRVVNAVAERLFLEGAAKFVGRDAVDVTGQRAIPKRLLIVGGFERGIGVIDLAVGAFVVFGRIEHVLVQSLAVNRKSPGAGITDGAHAGRRTDVHHVKRGSGNVFGQAKDAAKADVFR